MYHYIFLLSLTQLGRQQVLPNAQKCADKWAASWKTLGGATMDIYFAAGPYDAVAVASAKASAVALQFATYLATEGFVSSTTMQAHLPADVEAAAAQTMSTVR